ncbi:flagellar hook-length control protein [Desulfosporosinus orientis DSM 765]|uniref:Flagellar hook-length control protein n=1 Tax=Desulfosporosinus orientis (strain ATCC 19365 / DSM 765 / NCIMB 8382 / VKM B-1628 / Singapore I) TaxID=768706 RepID=G7WHX1_DESOD|nr:flagellar hook-length control protein FliK [Desulfosporosinus orientis]AET70268.1 flagellar hook-length control protein [Desulfosporosinus orientis DSM 765]
MTGINVLSDILKSGSKSDNAVMSKGNTTSGSCDNAASLFSALLNGRMNLLSNSKGQNSAADQDSEKDTNGNPGHKNQDSNGLESIQGFGNFALPFLAQLMLQSDFPAGKEANSGETSSQEIINSLSANPGLAKILGEAGNLEMAMMNLVSLAENEELASTGMTTQSLQGQNLGTAELDEYRKIIAELLVSLSGTVTDRTPGTSGQETITRQQEAARILQGWTQAQDSGEKISALPNVTGAADKETNDILLSLSQLIQAWLKTKEDSGEEISGLANSSTTIASGNDKGNTLEQNAKAADLLAAFYSNMKETEGAKESKGTREALINRLKDLGLDLEAMTQAGKDNAAKVNLEQKSEGMSLRESKPFISVQNFGKEELSKDNSVKSIDITGTKEAQTQPSTFGSGAIAGNVSLVGAEGKLSALPLWEHISSAIREQVMNKQQILKELDIQLHPAELGNIKILMRWDGGQVHLHVHAAEAATGQLLHNQLPDLRQNLVSQGVNCGSLQMGLGGEGQQQPQGETHQTLRQSEMLANEDEDPMAILDLNSLEQDETNRLNVTA